MNFIKMMAPRARLKPSFKPSLQHYPKKLRGSSFISINGIFGHDPLTTVFFSRFFPNERLPSFGTALLDAQSFNHAKSEIHRTAGKKLLARAKRHLGFLG